MARRADDPYAFTYTQIFTAVFGHFARASGRPAKAIARAADCTESYLSMIGKADRLPSLDKTHDLDRATGADGLLVEVRRLLERLETQRAMHGHTLGTESPSSREDDVKRRAALELLGALGALTTLPIDDLFAGIDRVLVDRVDLDEWDRTVHEYFYLVNARPVGSLINDLAADIRAVDRVISEHDHSAGVRARLLRVVAGLSGLLATDLDETGQRRSARVAWGTARRSADASGDRDLSVWVRAKEAAEARWAGRPESVIADLADEAIAIAKDAPSAGLARAYAARATLSARRGETSAARTALDDLSTVTEHGVPGWREHHWRWNEAYVYTVLGDDRAAPAVDRAQALYPPGTLGPLANLELIRALGLIKNREVNEGLGHALSTLQAGPVSATRRHLTGQILGSLPNQKAWALPAVRELRALASGPA